MKKLMMIAVMLALTACVTRGQKFEMSDVDAMQPGVTTKEEAIGKLGKPKAVSNRPDGSTLLQWMFIEASPLHGKGSHAAILFDKDGKMIRVSHKSE